MQSRFGRFQNLHLMTLQQAITRVYRGEGLSLERLLLDLHSGRIFGSIGVLVYDLLALALGFLSISGLVLWFRSRRNGKVQIKKMYDCVMKYVFLAIFVLIASQPMQVSSCDMQNAQQTSQHGSHDMDHDDGSRYGLL